VFTYISQKECRHRGSVRSLPFKEDIHTKLHVKRQGVTLRLEKETECLSPYFSFRCCCQITPVSERISETSSKCFV
jgi:hypothetical protein